MKPSENKEITLGTYSTRVLAGMQVGFDERLGAGTLSSRGFDCIGTDISENGRINAAREPSGTDVGVGADPVIAHGLVCIELIMIM